MAENIIAQVRARTIAQGMPLPNDWFYCVPGKGGSIVVTLRVFLKKQPKGAALFAKVALYIGRFHGWYERPNVFIIPPDT